jgi:hypothetical protein
MTTLHLNDDDLVLHYYGEMAPSQEAATVRHLDACSQCQLEYARLERVLGAVDAAAELPLDLPPSFERTVWARLEPTLEKGGSSEAFGASHRRTSLRWLFWSPAPVALAASIVVLVVGAFFAGRAMAPAPAAPSAGAAMPATAAAGDVRERIFLVDLGQHLDRSQMMLVELVSGGETDVDLAGERARAEDLVADNRLYRLAAEQTGDAAVTDLLDEIERILTEIAASPDRISSQELAAMRRRIEARDLLFKVRVVSSEVRERQKEALRQKTGQRS